MIIVFAPSICALRLAQPSAKQRRHNNDGPLVTAANTRVVIGIGTQIGTQLFETRCQLAGRGGMNERESPIKSNPDGIGRYALGWVQWFTKPLLYH